MIEEKDGKIAKLTTQLKLAEEEAESLTKDVEAMSESMAQMSDDQKKAESQWAEKETALKLKIGELEDELEEQKDLLKLQIAEQQKQQAEFSELIDRKEEDAKKILRQLHDTESEVEELTTTIDDVLAQLKESEKECQRLCSLVEEETARSMKLESEVEGLNPYCTHILLLFFFSNKKVRELLLKQEVSLKGT